MLWPVSMLETEPIEGIPPQAIQALNKKVLDVLLLQNLPMGDGPKSRFTQRFPFPVLPEEDKRRQVLQETTIDGNKKIGTLILTFEEAGKKMPVQLKQDLRL